MVETDATIGVADNVVRTNPERPERLSS